MEITMINREHNNFLNNDVHFLNHIMLLQIIAYVGAECKIMNKLSNPFSTHLKKMIQGSQVFQGEFRNDMALWETHSDEEPVLPFQTMKSHTQKVTYTLFAVVTHRDIGGFEFIQWHHK